MSHFHGSVCDDERRELRQSAADFYRVNRVPEQLERALNELCTRRPSDLYGYLAEFFSTLSCPPRISRVQGLEVLDSRGQPSVQAQVYCVIRNQEKLVSSASVSSNDKERAEQVSNALRWIQDLNQQLQDLSPEDQSQVDHILSVFYSCRLLENTETQSKDDSSSTSRSNTIDTPAPGNKRGKKGSAVRPLPPPEPPEPLLPGGLAVGALSLSVARAGAQSRGWPLYRHIAALRSARQPPPHTHLPSLLVSVLSCGKSSPGKLHLFEEILLIPKPGLRARQVVSTALELQKELQRILSSQTKAGALGALLSDCGAPCLSAEKVEQPLELLCDACSNLELSLGSELFLGLSCAAPGLFDYDQEQWERLSASVSDSCSLLSDITYRAQAPPPPGVRGHVLKHAHHVTISDLIRARAEHEGSVLLGPSCSEPSSDPSLPDVAVGLGLDFVKLGGLSGSERTTRYNRIIAIEDELEREGRLVFKEKLLPPIFHQRPDQDQDQDQDQAPPPESS